MWLRHGFQVAAVVGASAPHIVALDGSFNAYSMSVGLRRRRMLCLGRHGPARWRAAADEARAAGAARIPLLRQLSIRDEVSLFASHPPRGLRSRMVDAREWRDAGVTLTESRAAQVDAELARDYERAGRDIAWSD